MKSKDTIVIALGGNAISKKGDTASIPAQFIATRNSAKHLVDIIEKGYDRMLITHGNGPQVGNIILRSEIAGKILPPLPIDICGADSQGGMGYMIQQCFLNELKHRKLNKNVVTVITQVLVDPKDPAFKLPTKPIGSFYTERKAKILSKKYGWKMVNDANRGFRRVIASPRPYDILEKDIIKQLINNKCIVIGAGGGGIPVVRKFDGNLVGISAVVDKDLSSCLIAKEIDAKILIILTAIDNVMINFKSNPIPLKTVTLKEIKDYYKNNEFSAGSMGPKIEASIKFLEGGGREVIITSLEKVYDALFRGFGTHIK